jgi:predicted Rdx family selenoprotein
LIVAKNSAADVELVGGRSGIFDIDIDGTHAYSKHETGQFPSDEDVHALLT